MARRAHGLRTGLAAVGTLIALALAFALYRDRRPSTAGPLDADLIAIAPFDVLDSALRLWHEGLVDVLARDLDGAGSLRTVSPTTTVRRWHGRADPASAAELARATGARLAVFGTVVTSAGDSVRLAATLLDASRGRALGEVEVRGALSEMDRLTDSLAVGLLRQLGRSRPVGVVRHTGLSARSLPALKAFLQAEQYYRRGVWDSAQSYAEQAVALDPTFALAYRRLWQAMGWQPTQGDSIANVYGLRAGALNHGLAPRDSLLVLADSLFRAASARGYGVGAEPALGSRLFATLEYTVRRYGDDPEAWYALGEMRHHLGGWLLRTGGWRASLEAFERSVALDPLFAPAYYHLVEIGFSLGDSARARRYAAAAVRLNPRGTMTRAFQAVDRLLAVREPAVRARVIDSLPADVLWDTFESLARWPDSAELSVEVARGWARRPDLGDDSVYVQATLVHQLAFRGHLREARAAGDTLASDLFSEAALLGGMTAERATAWFERCVPARTGSAWSEGSPPVWCLPALNWWNARRDTVPILTFLRAAERSARKAAPGDSIAPARIVSLARANLALARRDTASALRAYEPLIRSVAPWWCQGDRLVAARLLAVRGQLRQAAAILSAAPTLEGEIGPRLSDVVWLLERGRVAEQLGDRERAADAYRYVADVWRHADPELQPYTAEARAALDRLAMESRR